MACSSLCTKEIPVLSLDPCGVVTKQGGISYLVFAKCNANIPYDDLCNMTLWQDLVNSCDLRITGYVVGSKGATTFTKTKVSSCLPDQVTGGEQTIVFKDLNSNKDNSIFDFYNAILEAPSSFIVGWVTCDGELYGFYPFTIELSEVVDEDYKGTKRFEGNLMITERYLIKPVKVPSNWLQTLIDGRSYSCDLNDYVVAKSDSCENIILSPENRTVNMTENDVTGANVINIDRIGTPCAVGSVLFAFSGVPAGMTIGQTQLLTTNTLTIVNVGVAVGTYYIGVDGTHSGCNVDGDFFIVIVTTDP